MIVHICFYLAGLYCSGWVKRGPYGNTPVTMLDAFETADKILEDLEQGKTVSSRHVCACQVKPYPNLNNVMNIILGLRVVQEGVEDHIHFSLNVH